MGENWKELGSQTFITPQKWSNSMNLVVFEKKKKKISPLGPFFDKNRQNVSKMGKIGKNRVFGVFFGKWGVWGAVAPQNTSEYDSYGLYKGFLR